MAIRHVLIVEDLAEAQIWLSQSVQLAFDDCSVMTAATLKQAEQCLAHQVFDLVLLDIGLPDGSGLQLINAIHLKSPHCLVVMATLFDDDAHVFTALRKGAKGYILKDQSKDNVAQMLLGIEHGHFPISPAVANKLLQFFQPTPAKNDLTPREQEVLTLVAKGYAVPQVADLLTIKKSTCYGYVKDIYRKLNINSRAEAAMEATKMGLITPDH
ncbi:response regulator [Marinicella gelatinilytica]|uniref:response regulator n=1 Tax=Marinicella gelatinilytica TaxID=2996017 RepID=UPI002260D303|nr:response regulator transcription factor [Marinicella gelatinilytica]MCX7545926.1 response regulator transcription factor [Marinicella gelatinilytica]